MMNNHSFKDHFLIAMPGLADPRFSQSVTYICEHNKRGAMGIIINQPANISYSELFNQLQLNDQYDDHSSLLIGGPVQKERGFVLHTSEKKWSSTLAVSEKISITGSKDILTDIANHKGPDSALIALGYAGWNAGQLEDEIKQNSWLTVPAEEQIIFNTPTEKRWTYAAKQLGIDLNLLSPQAGHA
ncbi:MAG: putative transcriptional regulator [Kiritimatiellia bacterium]|jgi:putative transcriptional regulator